MRKCVFDRLNMVRRSSRIAKLQSDSESDEPTPVTRRTSVRRAATPKKKTEAAKKKPVAKKKSAAKKKTATKKKPVARKKATSKKGTAAKESKARSEQSPRDESAARGAWVLNKPEFRSSAKLKSKSLLSPIPSFGEEDNEKEGEQVLGSFSFIHRHHEYGPDMPVTTCRPC